MVLLPLSRYNFVAMIDPPGDNSAKALMSRRDAGWDKSGEP